MTSTTCMLAMCALLLTLGLPVAQAEMWRCPDGTGTLVLWNVPCDEGRKADQRVRDESRQRQAAETKQRKDAEATAKREAEEKKTRRHAKEAPAVTPPPRAVVAPVVTPPDPDPEIARLEGPE
jgi:hypothetical protein